MSTIDRATVITAVRDELDARALECREEHAAIGGSVADRLGLLEPPSAPARGRVWLFGRRQSWLPLDLTRRFGGVILATRSASAAKPNRSVAWCEAAREAGVELAGWDWALDPGAWRSGLAEHVRWLASVGAIALCINVEPMSTPARDWRRKHDELRAYTTETREHCDRHGLELWVTSWSLPTSAPTFPWLELFASAHRAIPQCYEVHGRAGAAYVAQAMAEYRERGARELILGRAAHELDKSDSDAWRTPAEVAQHRSSTPAGVDEAWWLAMGTPPADVVDAMLAP